MLRDCNRGLRNYGYWILKNYRHSKISHWIWNCIPRCIQHSAISVVQLHTNAAIFLRCCRSIHSLLNRSRPTRRELASLTECLELISDYYGWHAGSIPNYSDLVETRSCMRFITDKCCVGRTFSAPSANTERREETGVKVIFKCATEGNSFLTITVSKYRARARFF